MAGLGGLHEAHVIHVQGRTVSCVASTGTGVAACLSPADGAEMSSLTIRDTSGTHELLYRGNDWRPTDGWAGRAPWLWPAAGRTYGQTDPSGTPCPQSVFHWGCGERVLPMPHHGFARFKQWRAEATKLIDGGARAHASLKSSGEDHGSYPFNYRLDTEVAVCDSAVTLTMRVTADRDNAQSMPFTIGQHITLDLASWWGKDWLQGTLSGAGLTCWGIDRLKLVGDPLELPSQPVVLADRLLGDLLIPAMPGKALRMTSPDRTKYIDMSFTVSSLPSADAALWVVHRDKGGRFFCLEPWIGWPNGLSSGRGRIELEPGDVWSISLQLNIMPIGSEDAADVPLPGVIHINPAIADSIPRRGRRSAAKNQRVTEES